MTDWRGDLLKIGIIPDDMPDQTNFVLFNLDELNHFIEQELDKAREEGFRNGYDECREIYKELFTKISLKDKVKSKLVKEKEE